jgi:hypothetical protein
MNKMRCMGRGGCLGLTRVQVIRKKTAQGVRPTGRGIQNRELRDGAISTPGEVTHRPILRREGTRTRITHRKGWSGRIGGVVYSKAKSMLESE